LEAKRADVPPENETVRRQGDCCEAGTIDEGRTRKRDDVTRNEGIN